MPSKTKQTSQNTQSSTSDTESLQSSQQSGTQAGLTVRNPYGESGAVLDQIIRQAGQFNPNLTAQQKGALEGIDNAAGMSAMFAPDVQGMLSGLFLGGGFGTGINDVKANYELAEQQLRPVARGDHLNPTNPYTQGLLSQITDNARNAVGGAFAGAGRSFSGAHADTVTKAITEGTAPFLFDQYNREQDRQTRAISDLMNMGVLTSGVLDDAAARKIGAQTTGAGLLPAYQALVEQPYRTQLETATMRQRAPMENLGLLSNIVLPIASTFGETRTSGTSDSTGTSEATGSSMSEGESFGTAETIKKESPLKTALGAALGIGGLLMGNPAGLLGGLGGAAGGLGGFSGLLGGLTGPLGTGMSGFGALGNALPGFGTGTSAYPW